MNVTRSVKPALAKVPNIYPIRSALFRLCSMLIWRIFSTFLPITMYFTYNFGDNKFWRQLILANFSNSPNLLVAKISCSKVVGVNSSA